MMRKKALCLALCLALLLAALPVALAEPDAPRPARRLRLGSSAYTIEIDESYMFGKVTPESVEAGRVAFLYSGDTGVDFDVCQISATDDRMTLAEFVAGEAAAREGADEIVPDAGINGIPVGWFHAETNDGLKLHTVTYVLEDSGDFIEIVFRMTNEDAEAEAQGIVNTLACENLVPVRLGSSPYWVSCDDSFHEGDMTDADVADDQVAYWLSEESLLDFDVYQFGKAGLHGDLADYVALEAEVFDADEVVPLTEANGIPLGWYRAVEEYEGESHETLTCVLDAGTDYVEIVFWLDGPTAEAEADSILQSLRMEDETGEAEADPEADGLETDVAGEVEDALEAVEAWAGEASDDAADILDAIAAWAGLAVDGAKEAFESAGEWVDEAVDEAGGTLDAVMEWLEAAANELEAAFNEDVSEIDGTVDDTQVLRLGTSAFTLTVPAGFVEGELSEEDVGDDQVAYYYSNDTLLDFDVYQFDKDGYPDDLAIYAEEETRGYNSVTALVTDGEINGVPAAWYRTVEDYNGVEFDTLTYILDGDGEYVEVVFWLDGDTAEAEADAIIRTLASNAGEEPLGGEGAVLVEEMEELSDARETSMEKFESITRERATADDAWAEEPDDGGDVSEPGE